MPKALLILRRSDFSWMKPLGKLHPLDLKILGLTLGERWAAWFRTQGIEEARILTEVPWEAHGSWNADQVRVIKDNQPLPLVLNSQKIFWDKSECLILQAPVFLHPGCQPKLTLEGHEMEPKVLWRSKAQAVELGPWRPLTSASHYYIGVLEALESERPLSLSPLPGESKPPVFLDRKVKAAGGELGPFTVLGENTTLGRGAKIKSTVCYGNTAVGAGIEFKEKLILGTTVITPGAETRVEIQDPKILKAL